MTAHARRDDAHVNVSERGEVAQSDLAGRVGARRLVDDLAQAVDAARVQQTVEQVGHRLRERGMGKGGRLGVVDHEQEIELVGSKLRLDRRLVDVDVRVLDDLVRAGKVRHIGFSDVPAWKAVQAQYEAIFRAWTPSIALQIEYSLLERTVEGDLMPMAREMGMGVTPWSPLKGGVLTGKYDRKSTETDAKRGAWVANHFNDRTFAVVDMLKSIASDQRVNGKPATPAHVALAWVRQKPGVTSTIIGARTMDQLTANLDSLALELSAADMQRLDEATAPKLPFPHEFVQRALQNQQAGTSVNGRKFDPWPLAPQSPSECH